MARCGFQAHGCARHRQTALGISSEELGGARGPGSAETHRVAQGLPSRKCDPRRSLFPSATGRPDGAMLEKLKAVAFRGELNCGHCAVSHKLEDGTVKINRWPKEPTVAVGSCTNFATRMPRDTSRTASTSGPCSNGWDTATSHRRWSISRASGTATFRPGSTRAASQHSPSCV